MEDTNLPAPMSLSQLPVPRLATPLGETLASVQLLSRYMEEAEHLCSHVCQRLVRIFHSLESVCAVPTSALDKFLWQTFRFHDFLSKFSHKKLVTRLVCSRKILEQTSSIHRELDLVATLLQGTVDCQSLSEDWTSQWREDCRLLRQGWESLRQDRSRLTAELLDSASQVEAMVLLKCEKETYFQKYSADELELLNAVFGYAASLSRAEVPHVPQWFIPPHEVDFAETPFSKGAFGSVHHGTWLDARVVVKRMLNPVDNEIDRGVFMNEIKIWYYLNFPHVVKLHGACHVGRPFFVCEFASNGILTDFLAREEREGRHVLWQKLYEVALGLHFLHERNVTHGDLKGNNILVSADGLAKLTDFGLSLILTTTTAPAPMTKALGALRWKAPEILNNTSGPSFEADIYSFGMSIIEAATHALPWGNQMPDSAVRYHVVNKHALPKRPGCLTDDQWELIQSMCAFESSDRPEIATVREKLKQFADKELNESFEGIGANTSSFVSYHSDSSMSTQTESYVSAIAQHSRTGSAVASSVSSSKTFSSSSCSNNTLVGDESMAILDLQEYLGVVADLVAVQCDTIDEICKEAKELQLTDPEDFITKRYDDRLREIRSGWLARNRVTQDTLTNCMLIYEDNAQLQEVRSTLQRKLLEHASEAVQAFNGKVDPARAF